VTFSDEERTEWIGAVSKTAEMGERLLDALARTVRGPLAARIGARKSLSSTLWRQQLDRLRSGLTAS
jgi:hypothetical protein